MHKFDDYTGDAPPGWSEYAGMLRSQPAPAMAPERAGAMLPAIHAAMPTYMRRRQIIRYISAPALSFATAILAFVLGVLPALDDEPVRPTGLFLAKPVVKDQSRPAHRRDRRRLEIPYVPESDFTQLPDTVTVLVPRIAPEPIVSQPSQPGPGPGIARLHGASGR